MEKFTSQLLNILLLAEQQQQLNLINA